MFRRVQPIAHREEEIVFPVDMKKLGYFINEQDQLRQIQNPTEPFQYRIHRIERVNERHRESFDECIRRVLDKRFEAEGLSKQCLPPGSDPKKDKCVPILVSDDIDETEKVLVVIGNTVDDLGVWSIREIEGDIGINRGSMVETIQTAKAAGFSLLILNCGQQIYSPELGRAVTYQSWKSSTKKSPYIDEVLNRVPGHENVANHVRNTLDMFKHRIRGKKVYMLTYGWGCWALMKYLNEKFDEWKPSLQAIIAVESTHTPSDIKNPALENFLRFRTRAYIVHADPPGSFIPDKRFICQTFSSSQMFSECIIPNNWRDLMLEWFKRVETDPEGFNPVIEVDWEKIQSLERDGEWDEKSPDNLPEDKWAVDDDDSDDLNDYGGGLGDIVDLRELDAPNEAQNGGQSV